MRKSFIFMFLSGLVVGILLSHCHSIFRSSSVQAAVLPAAEELELGKKTRPEIESIVLSEFEKFAVADSLTPEGRALVQEVANERVVQLLTQETSREIRRLRKVESVSLNYNKSEVPSPVAMSADGQLIVVSGSEGILLSQDRGNSWEKVVKD